MRRCFWLLGLGLMWMLGAGRASAHPLVDEGIERYQDADFRGALDLLSRAEAAGDLSRADLADLFHARALVHFAMSDREAMAQDLSLLAALQPDRAMGREVPPAVREAFQQALTDSEGAPEIAVTTTPVAGGLQVRVEVVSGDRALVRGVRLAARPEGADWTRFDGDSLQVPATEGATVDYFAEAVGPGGAVVASAGTESEPRSVVVTSPVAEPGQGSGPLDGDGAVWLVDGDGAVWLAVGVGAAVVVIAAVVIAVVLLTTGGSGDRTQFGYPQLNLP